MKRFLLMLVPCGLIAMAAAAGMSKWKEEARPEIRVTGATTTSGHRQGYVLEMVNPTDRELGYWGYGPDQPMYRLEKLEAGVWRPAMLGWCGTGAAPQTLAAHGTQRFAIYPEKEVMRVGMLLLPSGFQPKRVYQFEMLPFPLRKHLVKWQNARNERALERYTVWSEPLDPLPELPSLSAASGQ